MIATSYYAKAARYPDTFKIAISRSIPNWFKPNCQLTWLAPSWSMLSQYKLDHNENKYTFKYLQMLADKNKVLEYLVERMNVMERKQNVLLLCWETSGKFCHRHLLADYLNVRFGTNIVEL